MKVCSALVKALLQCLLIFIFLSSNGFAAKSSQALIIDTDGGVDDVIAILYLLSHSDIEVKAITITSMGIAACEPAFRNISGLLSLMQKKNIPMACGRDHPLQGNHQFPERLISESNVLSGVATLLPKTVNPVKTNAVDLLISTISHAHTPVTILAIGPLTNLAEAIKLSPDIKKNIQMIYVMGGAINVPGNLNITEFTTQNMTAEWNIYLDPYAASIVFSAKIPVSLIPLDVTNTVPIDWNFYQKLKQRHTTQAANFVYELLRHNEKYLQTKKWFFWDPLAAVLASDQSFASWHQQPIQILLTPESQSGAMIINKKIGNPIRICTQVNKKYFETLLLKTIN